MFFWRILRTLGSLIGVSGGKALFQFLPSWDQFPTAALLSEVLILNIIINRYCHHTAWARYWARGWWNLFVPSWFASPHQHHSACAQRYHKATISTWPKKTKHQQHQKKHRRHYDKRTKKQNPKTPTQQKSQKQKVSSYSCSTNKTKTTTAHEQRKTT